MPAHSPHVLISFLNVTAGAPAGSLRNVRDDGGLEGFRLRLIDPESLRPLAGMVTSWRKPKLANPFTDICGGTYFYLDRDDVRSHVGGAEVQVVQLDLHGIGAPVLLGSTGTGPCKAPRPSSACAGAAWSRC
jgi:hypothetical protein